MDTPASRLKWAREHRGGYSSATEAAEARGWNASTYRTHENGQRNFPTAMRVRRRGNVTILVPDSTDARWHPVELDGDKAGDEEEVGIVALVIGIYRPLKKHW